MRWGLVDVGPVAVAVCHGLGELDVDIWTRHRRAWVARRGSSARTGRSTKQSLLAVKVVAVAEDVCEVAVVVSLGPLEVVLEGLGRPLHFSKLSLVEHRLFPPAIFALGQLELVLLERVVSRQRRCDLEGVADLAAVPPTALPLGFGAMLPRELDNGRRADVELRLARELLPLLLDLGQPVQVHLEDELDLRLVQRRVVEAHVDTRLEGLVKRPDAVGRQEENAVVVLENAEENCCGPVSISREHQCLPI